MTATLHLSVRALHGGPEKASYLASGKSWEKRNGSLLISFRSYHMIKWKFNITQAFHMLLTETMAEARHIEWLTAQPILAHFSKTTNKNTSLKTEVLETSTTPKYCWEYRCKLGLCWASLYMWSPQPDPSFLIRFGYMTLSSSGVVIK